MKQANKSQMTRAAGLELAESFYQSNLKPKEFCAQKNIPYHILQYWKVILNNARKECNTQPKFFPVNVLSNKQKETSSSMPLRVIINSNLIIEISPHLDVATLKNVIEACKICG